MSNSSFKTGMGRCCKERPVWSNNQSERNQFIHSGWGVLLSVEDKQNMINIKSYLSKEDAVCNWSINDWFGCMNELSHESLCCNKIFFKMPLELCFIFKEVCKVIKTVMSYNCITSLSQLNNSRTHIRCFCKNVLQVFS